MILLIKNPDQPEHSRSLIYRYLLTRSMGTVDCIEGQKRFCADMRTDFDIHNPNVVKSHFSTLHVISIRLLVYIVPHIQ